MANIHCFLGVSFQDQGIATKTCRALIEYTFSDLRLNTKLLILLEITIVSHSKLKPIADRLGITVQGISEYIKIMQSEGLVHITGGGYKATKKGVQFLHENIRDLKEFVERTMKRLEVIDLCAAIAKTRIKEGSGLVFSWKMAF